ncbi:MAG: hypothetical protein P8R54_30105 [Myxococcota bacterium]|nr:hypothetical protein [Myxococcota bacterium]
MIAFLLACSGDEPGDSQAAEDTSVVPEVWALVEIDPDAQPPPLLSELGLTRWDGSALSYHDEALAYELNTPLFSDFALKERAVWMPEGRSATVNSDGTLDFPVGTVILKSFLFPADFRAPQDDLALIETRVMLRGSAEWTAWPYLWRADGSDAELHVSGDVQTIDFIDPHGASRTAQYLVPQRNQCVDCHDQYDATGERVLMPIGPNARALSSAVLTFLTGTAAAGADVQVDWTAIESGGVDSLSPAEVETAARDYLDINCAHCHSPKGVEGVTSQFFLNHDNTDAFNLGICKRPGSAGEGGVDREFDIVPGDPKASILWYRTATEDIGAMMPDIGRSLTHDTGAELIWRWIAEMEPDDCQ